MTKNLCSKKVTPEAAYEVWQSSDGTWTYYVLKKYQSPEAEAKNIFARWFCKVISPMSPNGDLGDVYVSTVKSGTQLVFNSLVLTTGQEVKKTLIVQAVTDEMQEHFTVTDLTPRARKHKRYQIELPADCVHTISTQHSIIGPIEFYDCQDGRIIVTDRAWNQINAALKKESQYGQG